MTDRGLRVDAQRNHDLLLKAATRLFAERGPLVAMDDVAKAAGVGVGTLYRRFPDRQSLLLAVMRSSLGRLHTELLRESRPEAPAWDRLELQLRSSVELRLAMRVFAQLTGDLRAAILADPDVSALGDVLTKRLASALQAAQEAGVVREDITFGEIVALFSLLPADNVGPTSAQVSVERLRRLLLDALRPPSSRYIDRDATLG